LFDQLFSRLANSALAPVTIMVPGPAGSTRGSTAAPFPFADGDHCALSGFSMGGYQTQNITKANPTKFKYIGVMSMDCFLLEALIQAK
jgi:hypothetical protein